MSDQDALLNTEVEVTEIIEPTEAELAADQMLADLDDMPFSGTEYSDAEKELLETKSEDPGDQEDRQIDEDESDDEEGSVVDTPVGPLVEFKVKGEKVEMSLAEMAEKHPDVLQRMKDDLSGQVNWDKKYTELDKERKAFYTEKQSYVKEKENIESYIQSVRERTSNGDLEGGIKVLAELNGAPFHQYKAQLLQWALPQLVAQQDMSDAQLELQRREDELRYKEEVAESRTKRAEAEQTHRELIARVNDVRETHNIKDEEWDNALKQSEGKFKDLQIEDVVGIVQQNRIDFKTSEVISEIEEFPKESLDTLKNIVANNPDFDKETVKEIVLSAMSKVKQQQQAESVENEVKSKLGKKLKPSKPIKTEEEVKMSEIDAILKRTLG